MIKKIQEKIDKYELLENKANDLAEYHALGYILCDLQELLKAAKKKKKACCDSKAGKIIRIIRCRDCPYITRHGNLPDECTKFNLRIENYDVVHPICKL